MPPKNFFCIHGAGSNWRDCFACNPLPTAQPTQSQPVIPRPVSHISAEPSRKYVRYKKWIAANPDLISIGVRICQQRIAEGKAFYGGPKIAGDIRYEYVTVRGVEGFNVNNDFVPYLTRDINLQLGARFLEVRAAQADADMGYENRMRRIEAEKV